MVSGLPSSTGGNQKEVAPRSYTYGELLDLAFPYYLSIGMTPEQYWDGESEWKIAFRKAHKKKINDQNLMMWLQGRYIYDAVGSLYPLFNALSKKKEPYPYVSEPYAIGKEEKEQREKEKARRQYEQRIADMHTRMNKWNERFKQRKSRG